MTEFESWYKRQVDMGYLPDKDGYYHWPPKEFYEVTADDLDKFYQLAVVTEFSGDKNES